MAITGSPRDYHTFTVNGNKYAVSLKTSNYTAIDTVLGLTKVDEVPDDALIMNISEAVLAGLMAPIKVNLQGAGGKKRQAFVFASLSKTEEALGDSGLGGKKYGTWTIKKAYFEMDRRYVP